MRSLYAVYDRVSDHWNDVISCANDSDAIRSFVHSCSNPCIPELYLRDVALYKVGEFEELTGDVFSTKHKLLINGDDFSILSNRNKHFNRSGGFIDEISEEENDS